MRKMKKIILGSLLVSGALLSGGTQVFAGETGDTGRSKVDIEYTVNVDTTKPTDPTDPGNEVKPNPENPGTGNAGPLSIDYVSNIQFGKQKAYGGNFSYFANLDNVINKDDSKKEVPNYVQVTDNRGNNAGWSLSVKQDGFLKNAKQSMMEKAELRLLNGASNSSNGSILSPTVNQAVALKLDTTGKGINSTLVTAESGKGAGTWTTSFGKTVDEGKNSVELFVPGGTVVEKGAYSTTLVWTLSADAAQ